MSSISKPRIAPGLDVPLGPERQRALDLLADRWGLWILIAVHETRGARFSELAAEPGLSRRVLAERLRLLVAGGLLRAERYQTRPPRSQYLRTERGELVARLALAAVHVAAGGVLREDPLAALPTAVADPASHPAEALLAASPAEASRIYADTIEPIDRYDENHRSELLHTLETWLACDTSTSVTAARLYVHRHTVRYRLDRIAELSGLDPYASDGRERIALGLRARSVHLSKGNGTQAR